MFTWICPQCGREVPPSYNECPDCTGTQKAPAPAAAQPAAPPAPPPPQAPPPAARPAPEALPELPRTFASASPAPAAKPAWLVAVLSAVGAIVVVVGVFWASRYFSGTGEAATITPAMSMEKPAAAAAAKPKDNPLQKYVEI